MPIPIAFVAAAFVGAGIIIYTERENIQRLAEKTKLKMQSGASELFLELGKRMQPPTEESHENGHTAAAPNNAHIDREQVVKSSGFQISLDETGLQHRKVSSQQPIQRESANEIDEYWSAASVNEWADRLQRPGNTDSHDEDDRTFNSSITESIQGLDNDHSDILTETWSELRSPSLSAA